LGSFTTSSLSPSPVSSESVEDEDSSSDFSANRALRFASSSNIILLGENFVGFVSLRPLLLTVTPVGVAGGSLGETYSTCFTCK
jgi:hypothetical protein